MPKNGNGVFEIDGMTFRLWVKELKRSFKVTDTDNSDYDSFYEIVSAPKASHHMVFPYGQGTLEFEAYVTSGDDSLKMQGTDNGHINKWSGLSLNFIAMKPKRRP